MSATLFQALGLARPVELLGGVGAAGGSAFHGVESAGEFAGALAGEPLDGDFVRHGAEAGFQLDAVTGSADGVAPTGDHRLWAVPSRHGLGDGAGHGLTVRAGLRLAAGKEREREG